MKHLTSVFFILISLTSLSQENIEWTENYKLQSTDYLAEAPNTGIQQTVLGSFYVGFQIVNYELMTTRNLNKNVRCYFQKNASYIDSGDSVSTHSLLRYQQLIFDTYEINARWLRRKFFLERKRLLREGASKLQEESSAEHSTLLARIEKETSHGTDTVKIEEWEAWCKNELKNLADYCKTCKPVKRKKNKEKTVH